MVKKNLNLPRHIASASASPSVQAKMAGARQPQSQQRPGVNQPARQPVAPSVYRPQPVPKVLQTKMASGQRPQSGQPVRQPVAPPVYRPDVKKIVQPKMAVTAQPAKQPIAPPVYRPQQSPRVLQAKKNHKIVAPTPAQAKPMVIQPKRAMTPKMPDSSSTRQGAAFAVSPFPLTGMRGVARFGGNVVQRSAPAEEVDDLYEEPEDEGGGQMPGMDSMAIYRVMPEFEWNRTKETGEPDTGHGHFWSPTLEYVTDYLKKCGKDTTSVIIVKIPLSLTYLNFLKAALVARQLHAHNFGSAWKKYFGKANKGKNTMAISLKNDNGTPTITFNSLPESIKSMLGRPELVNG